MDIVFDTMWKDKITAHVEVHDNKVEVISYTDNVIENMFAVQSNRYIEISIAEI